MKMLHGGRSSENFPESPQGWKVRRSWGAGVGVGGRWDVEGFGQGRRWGSLCCEERFLPPMPPGAR